MTYRPTRSICCLAGALLALAVAGCGSSSSSSSSQSSSSASATSASSSPASSAVNTPQDGVSQAPSVRATAVAHGKSAAQAEGAQVAIPKETVGVLEVQAVGNNSPARTAAAIEEGAKILGWQVKLCDGQGVPAQEANCASTFLSEHVNVIFGEAVEAPTVQAQLAQAKSKGIPWINVTGPVAPSPLIESQAVYSEQALGHALGAYIAGRLKGRQSQIALPTINSLYALRLRYQNERAVLNANSNIHVVSVHDILLSNPVTDGHDWASTILTQYPKLTAIGMISDAEPTGVVSAVAAKYPGKQFPDRPLLSAPFDDLNQLGLIRKGELDAVAAVPVTTTGWIALDRAAEFFARKTPIPANAAAGYPLDFLPTVIVDKANLPANPNAFYPFPVDAPAFFATKWQAEFRGVS